MMRNRALRVIVPACAMLAGLAVGSSVAVRATATTAPAASCSAVTVERSDTERIVVRFEVPSFELRPRTIGDDRYVAIDAVGLVPLGRPGYPDVPVAAVVLGVPPTGEARVNVTFGETETLSARWPVAPARSADGREDRAGSVSTVPFPAEIAAVTDVGWFRGQRLVRLEIRPFQVLAGAGEVIVHRTVRAEVSFGVPSVGARGSAAGPPAPAPVARVSSAPPSVVSAAPVPAAAPVPGAPAPGAPAPAVSVPAPAPAAAAPTASPVPDDPFEAVLRGALANYDSARAWRVERGPTPADVDLAAAAGPTDDQARWNLAIDAEGMYRVTAEDLAGAGMVLGDVDPRNLSVFADGREEVAAWVEGESDGRFDPADAIVFHGLPAPSKYSAGSVYQIAVGDAPGRRMTSRDAQPTGGAAWTWYRETLDVAPNARYVSDKPDLPAGAQDPIGVDRFYWEQLAAPAEIIHTVVLTDTVAGDGTAALVVIVVGKSDLPDADPDHRLVVSVDGAFVGEERWDGDARKSFVMPVDAARLADGMAVVRLEAPGGMPGVAYDHFYVDGFTLDFPRALTARGDALAFDVPSAGDVVVTGFAGPQPAVYDVTAFGAPVRIEGAAVSTGPAAVTEVRFHGAGPDLARYVAVAGSGYRSPAAIHARPAPDLRRSGLGADYVVIAPADLLGALEPLVAHRAAAGHRVAAIDAQRIYDGFGAGTVDPTAIRAFLAYAYANWAAPAPSRVLLVGDATYDPKRYLPDSRPTLLPTFLSAVDPWLGEVPSDNAFAAIAGDDPVPDLAVGRMTAGDAAQAAALVDKIFDYETAPAAGDWRERVLVVADDADDAGDFPVISDAVVADHVPSAYAVRKVYHGLTHTDRQATRTGILAELNQGDLLVQYTGHGRLTSWGAENLLLRADMLTLTNDRRLPVLLDMTCLTGYFADPTVDSISETAVGAANGGAIASFSPTGFGVATGHDYLGRAFLDDLFAGGPTDLGAATLAGKLHLYAETTVGRDLLHTFVLLGDPGVRVPLPFAPTPTPTRTPSATATEGLPSGTPDATGTTAVTPTAGASETAAPGTTETSAPGGTETAAASATVEPSTSPPGSGTPTRTPIPPPSATQRPTIAHLFLPYLSRGHAGSDVLELHPSE